MAGALDESDELFVPIEAGPAQWVAETGLSRPRFFPSPTATTPDGLLCIGGRLSPDWLLDAYSHGIFPWPVGENEPLAWWSLDPRAIISLDRFHISRRLGRTIRGGKFQATCDQDFAGVIRGCATAPGRGGGKTWLTAAMIDAYCRLHEMGHAHSIEIWSQLPLPVGEVRGEGALPKSPHPNPLPEGERTRILAGGTYGVAIGGFFAADSMFTRVRDASKVAVVHLVAHLKARGFQLLDIQQWTPHIGRMGAVEIPRAEYLRRLANATRLPVSFGSQLSGDPRRSG